MSLKLSLFALLAAGLLAGCNAQHAGHDHGPGHSNEPTAAEIAASVKVGNTHCPVTGEPVGATPAQMVHAGKLYNFCCGGCAESFHKDPQKYISQMDADPAKYGIKK